MGKWRDRTHIFQRQANVGHPSARTWAPGSIHSLAFFNQSASAAATHSRINLNERIPADYKFEFLLVVGILHRYAMYMEAKSVCERFDVGIVVVGHQEITSGTSHETK